MRLPHPSRAVCGRVGLPRALQSEPYSVPRQCHRERGLIFARPSAEINRSRSACPERSLSDPCLAPSFMSVARHSHDPKRAGSPIVCRISLYSAGGESDSRWSCPNIRFAWLPVWLRKKEKPSHRRHAQYRSHLQRLPMLRIRLLRRIQSILVGRSIRALDWRARTIHGKSVRPATRANPSVRTPLLTARQATSWWLRRGPISPAPYRRRNQPERCSEMRRKEDPSDR